MKKNVSIRKQNGEYIVYFYDQRIITKVNAIGALILDCFLNGEMSVKEIAEKISEEYTVEKETAIKEVKDFLADILKRMKTSHLNEAEQVLLDKPIGVEIEITTACNLRCKHCFQGEYPEKYMKYETFTHIIDLLDDNGICEINLVGGEIFKHKDVMKMLQYMAKKQMAITIVTNAVAITDEIIQELAAIDRLYVLVSLDGTKELHDQIRGEGQFDKIMPIILKMRDSGLVVETLCTINAINVQYVRKIAEQSKEINVPVNFNLFKPFSNKHDYLIVKPEKFFTAVEDLLRMRVKEGYKLGVSDTSLVAYMLGLPERNECTATLSGLVINTDGKMLTCPYLLEAGYYKQSELPDFSDNFLEEWKYGEIFNEFRANGQKACQARSWIFSKDVKGYDPYSLESYKKSKNKMTV